MSYKHWIADLPEIDVVGFHFIDTISYFKLPGDIYPGTSVADVVKVLQQDSKAPIVGIDIDAGFLEKVVGPDDMLYTDNCCILLATLDEGTIALLLNFNDAQDELMRIVGFSPSLEEVFASIDISPLTDAEKVSIFFYNFLMDLLSNARESQTLRQVMVTYSKAWTHLLGNQKDIPKKGKKEKKEKKKKK